MGRFLSAAIVLLPCLALTPVSATSMSGKNKSISSDDLVSVDSKSRRGATGSVLSATGVPVSGAVVFAKSLDTPGKPIPEMAIVTNAEGRYHWPLKPGAYELTPILDGKYGVPGKVIVPRDGLGHVDLTMP